MSVSSVPFSLNEGWISDFSVERRAGSNKMYARIQKVSLKVLALILLQNQLAEPGTEFGVVVNVHSKEREERQCLLRRLNIQQLKLLTQALSDPRRIASGFFWEVQVLHEPALNLLFGCVRSEERRVGKECPV